MDPQILAVATSSVSVVYDNVITVVPAIAVAVATLYALSMVVRLIFSWINFAMGNDRMSDDEPWDTGQDRAQFEADASWGDYGEKGKDWQ